MNIKEDNNVIKLKKDVVKNVAIVFLAIMLVLTFFSNSIMNKSLPEVATQVVQSGTITEKIRGTGMVEADDPYSVMVQETRKIASVAVKVGDEVEKDQVLFYLEDSDSTELEEAQKALEDLILKYTTGALTGEMSDSAYKNATAGRVQSMNTYEAQIEAAKNRVKAAQELVDSLSRQISLADGTNTGSEMELAQVKLSLELAQQEETLAGDTYTKLKAVVDAGDADAASANVEFELAKLNLSNSKELYDNQQKSLETVIKAATVDYVEFKKLNEKYKNTNSNDELLSMIFKDGQIIDADALNDWVTFVNYPRSAYDDLTKSFSDYTKAQTDYNTKESAAKAASAKHDEYANAASKISAAESAYNSAKNKVTELQTTVLTLTNAQTEEGLSNKQLSKDLSIKKADAELELSKAKEAQTQLLTDISKTLDLTNQNSIIKEQQEKVAKLREKATGAVVTSPVSGTVLSIAKTAGESTSASEALATIQVAGKPMSMSFAVTSEQANKVKIGDEASLQNAWYYNNMRIVLTKIANDPNNPGRSKLLVFNVEGEVTNGENLSVTLGQRSREYTTVVPNSAIREDNRGKFILIIEEKGTPFGNRYKAKRVDVEVLTSDDNNTAIDASVDSWVYVITTSNKPIEPGQQVRLSDR